MTEFPVDPSWMSGFIDMMLGGPSDDDPRFKFSVGDTVKVATFRPDQTKRWGKDWSGHVGKILARRNGYPPPHFDCWFPLYYIDPLGELGENMLEAVK